MTSPHHPIRDLWCLVALLFISNAARAQIMLSQTSDHREALTAFLERRPPQYTNS